jgi:hypothetical protein
VDALVPWFAQHTSGNFELGVAGTLGIAAATWLGIRSMTWFLFATAGTPTLMAIIQRRGVGAPETPGAVRPGFRFFSDGFTNQLQKEFSWVGTEGERLMDAFLVPPMQVVAAALNFVTLLVANRHFVELPLETVRDLTDARTLVVETNHTRLKKAA